MPPHWVVHAEEHNWAQGEVQELSIYLPSRRVERETTQNYASDSHLIILMGKKCPFYIFNQRIHGVDSKLFLCSHNSRVHIQTRETKGSFAKDWNKCLSTGDELLWEGFYKCSYFTDVMLICVEEVFELTILWILKASVILTESFRQPLPVKLSPNHPLCYAKWKSYTRSPDWLAVFVAKDTNITLRRFVVVEEFLSVLQSVSSAKFIS